MRDKHPVVDRLTITCDVCGFVESIETRRPANPGVTAIGGPAFTRDWQVMRSMHFASDDIDVCGRICACKRANEYVDSLYPTSYRIT